MLNTLSRTCKSMSAPSADDDAKYQIFVLGPGAVGKTALTIRFLSDNFIDEVIYNYY